MFPSRVLFYFPTRSKNRIVATNVIQADNQGVPIYTFPVIDTWQGITVDASYTEIMNRKYATYATIHSVFGEQSGTSLYIWKNHFYRWKDTGEPAQIYSFGGKYTHIVGNTMNRGNVTIEILGTLVPPSLVATTPPLPPQTASVAPAPLKKKHRIVVGAGTAEMSPHIARQLLELAQLKHEMCPITAEEFISGETAVMPCGHLFMRFGLDETFKKADTRGACPACRQKGAPVYV